MSGHLHIPDDARVDAVLRHHEAWGRVGHQYPPMSLVHIHLGDDGLVLNVKQAEALRDALIAALTPPADDTTGAVPPEAAP